MVANTTPGLSVAAELEANQAVLRALHGPLDERLDATLLEPRGATHVIFDLERVNHVSSFGVREWVRDLRELFPQGNGAQLFFVRTSSRVTDQFNMVMGFDAGGVLLSFYATYLCPTCDHETDILFDTQLDRPHFEALEAPDRQCTVCGRMAELDDDPSVLFEYVRATETKPIPPAVRQLLRDEQSWLLDVPGVRLTTRQTMAEESVLYRWAGILDEQFSPRRMASLQAPFVTVDVAAVRHFDQRGLGKLSELFRSWNDVPVSLKRCTPTLLRRWVEHRDVFEHAMIQSVLLPATSGRQERHWLQFDPAQLASLTSPKVETQHGIFELQTPMEDVRDFAGAINDTAPRVSTPPPTPANRPPPPPPPLQQQASKAPRPAQERYETLAKIGQGGMAEVFLVRFKGEMGFRRAAIVKKILPQYLIDDRMVRLFLEEAKLAARLDHTNVVRVYDLGRSEGRFYIVMEYVHGQTLSNVLRHQRSHSKPCPPEIAVAIAVQLCEGLARAHSVVTQGRPLLHRDLTPNNVLVDFNGAVKIADFGLAGQHHMQKDRARAGNVLGSAPFVPPEIYAGDEATPASDLWDVGLLLWLLLTNTHPFYRETLEETIAAVLDEKLPKAPVKIPRRLSLVVHKCLDKKPTRRYPNTEKLLHDLRQVARKLPEPPPLGAWFQAMFAPQLELEERLCQQLGVTDIQEAFLQADPALVSSFFIASEKLRF